MTTLLARIRRTARRLSVAFDRHIDPQGAAHRRLGLMPYAAWRDTDDARLLEALERQQQHRLDALDDDSCECDDCRTLDDPAAARRQARTERMLAEALREAGWSVSFDRAYGIIRAVAPAPRSRNDE